MTEAMRLLFEQLVQNISPSVSLKEFYYRNFSSSFETLYDRTTLISGSILLICSFAALVFLIVYLIKEARRGIEGKYKFIAEWGGYCFLCCVFLFFPFTIFSVCLHEVSIFD